MATTTLITTVFDDDAQELITGEAYPIFSNDDLQLISESEAAEILKVFSELKLNRYYDCIRKATIIAHCFGIKTIHLGSLIVNSTEKGVSYGYEYHPPLELHAWVQLSKSNIIDFALAGTIEKGLKTKDDVGYFLVGRKPIILAGISPDWVHYKTYEVVPIERINIISTEEAKELLKKMI